MSLLMDKTVTPVAVHTPTSIAVLCAKQVKDGLGRNVRLGLLESVSVNEPTTWFCRMFITLMHSGSPG